MLKVDMFSSADKVAGQGVGSAYLELLNLLNKYLADVIQVDINNFHERANISHYHTIDPQFYLSTFSKKRGRKIGYVHFLPETLEGSLKIPQPFRSIFYRYVISFYKRMDHIVVVNPSFISKLVKYGIAKEKITYIPNFVSQTEFYVQSDAQKHIFRQQLHIADDKFIVFGDGQVQERKGVDDFITLAKNNPEIEFIWAGGFSFGKMTDGYERFKKIMNNPPTNLHFPGIVKRSELVNYYNIADLFLLPSYDELFPMSVLEAFNCHTPVLLRDLDLYHAIISGYYAPAKNVNEMNRLILYLQNHPQALKQLQQASVKGATKYSEQNLARIWQQFYQKQAIYNV